MTDPSRMPVTRALFARALEGASDPTERARDLGVAVTLHRLGELTLPRHAWLAHAADTIARRAVLVELTGALTERGVPFAALKGEPLARRLFGDPLARRSGDIDLLVDLDDVHAAAEILTSRGYEPLYSVSPEPWVVDEWPFVHRPSGQVVEIHWALAAPQISSPPARVLLGRLETLEIGDAKIPVLDPADCALNLALHFHHHVGFFKGLIDVSAWIDAHSSDDLELAAQRAARHGISEILHWPLCAASSLGALDASVVRRAGARAWLFGWATASAVEGALAASHAIGGAHPLAFKTSGISRVGVTSLQCLSGVLVDAPIGALVAALSPLSRSPRSFAMERGSDRVELFDWLRFLARPLNLFGGVLSDRFKEMDRP